MTESKYTDKVIDCISNYIASAKLAKEKLTVESCLKAVAADMNYPEDEVNEAFGDIIKKAITNDRYSERTFDESFSASLTEEADVNNIKQSVDNAETTQKGGSSNASDIEKHRVQDKEVGTGHNTRMYFAYTNLLDGKMFICSMLQQHKGLLSGAFAKLGNFLATVTGPIKRGNILVTPISEKDAKSYVANQKVKYLNLTPQKQENQGQQNTAKAEAKPAEKQANGQQTNGQQTNGQQTNGQQANGQQTNGQQGAEQPAEKQPAEQPAEQPAKKQTDNNTEQNGEETKQQQ